MPHDAVAYISISISRVIRNFFMFIFKVRLRQMKQPKRLIALQMQHYRGSVIRAYATQVAMRRFVRARVITQQ